jgi:hypothetical protein
VTERFFTPEEVEKLIPVLTEIMEAVMAAHTETGALRDRIRAEEARVAMSGGAVIDRQAWHAATERLKQLAGDIEKALMRIAELGGVPKDLTLGLVDFPHLREGRVVNLCWKHGEREIRYWHGLEEGFASRKPLERGEG